MAIDAGGGGSVTAEQYLAQLQALLPSGAAWPREEGSVLTNLLLGLADELARLDERAQDLLDEADPRTALELLIDWERVTGLPDPCVGIDPSTEQRRQSLLQKLTALGGQSPAYYIAAAAALGFAITIDEFLEHTVEDDVDHQLFGTDWNFTWQVNAPLNTVGELSVQDTVADPLAWWSNEPLECVLEPLKPAHTHIIFAYA